MTAALVERELATQVAAGSLMTTASILPVLHMEVANIEALAHWPLLSKLPVKLTISIPLAKFRVKDLLAITKGGIVNSLWPKEEDVPVRIGSVLVSWGEFEVVDQRMAIRLTRLA